MALMASVFFIFGVKLCVINRYGVDIPFWDQWGAEAQGLYIPLVEGRLHVVDLFRSHNEHYMVNVETIFNAALLAKRRVEPKN